MPIPTTADRGISIYQPVSALETPVITVDLDVMERNIRDFASFARNHDVRLRSHAKNHKIPALARLQHDLTDGGGIMCQKLDEVEVMAHGGVTDLYLSHMVVTDRKLDRLVSLARSTEAFATTVDGPGNVDPVERAGARHDTRIDVIMEVDVGYGRTGVEPGDPAVDLASYIAGRDHLRFRGILAFEGFVRDVAGTRDEFERRALETMDTVARTVELIEDAGVTVPEVKVGCTATAKFSGTHPVVTEINPGTYPFNDAAELDYRGYEIGKEDCATTVITTVVSKPNPDRVIVDAGSKTVAIHGGRMPVPKTRSDIRFYNASEEHGWVDVSEATEDIDVGDRLEFIVPRSSPTMNLHDSVVGIRDGTVEVVWDVQARGKVR